MVYFDQDLIFKVEGNSVYKENKNQLTLNKDDEFLADGAKVGDPIMQYVQLGEGIQDGLLAWISFGVNKTLGREIDVAATLTDKHKRQYPTFGPNGGAVFPTFPPPNPDKRQQMYQTFGANGGAVLATTVPV